MRYSCFIGMAAAILLVAPAAAAQSPSENGGREGGRSRLHEAARMHQSVAIGGSTSLGPTRYVVRSGDTLWDICTAQLANPWLWPEVWSLNPEITNPHWIYPGQVLRLRFGEAGGAAYGWGEPTTMARLTGGTVFFRSEGFIDETRGQAEDEEDEPQPPGEIVASWEDEMMLAYPDLIYVRFREDFPIQPGQEYTIYRVRETVTDFDEDDSGDPVVLGKIVEILGTGRVETWDPDAHLARVKVTESINPIERGDAVGPIERNFVVSEPRAAEVDLDGRIVALLRPRVLNGEGFVVFVNRGYQDGVRDGNRFQIIRATDHYLESWEEDIPPDLPFEWIGECQVLEARKTASTCLITASTREMFLGERVSLIRGQ
jgi:hypothetical protein